MKLICANIVIVWLLVSLVSGCGQKQPTSTVPAALTLDFVSEPPLIDGSMTEACWDSLETVMLQRCDNGNTPEFPTTLRACYDASHIYLGFECQDPKVSSTVTTYDGSVFAEDHIAIYIDADSDTTTYAIIEIAPSGAIRDAFVLSRPDGSSRVVLTEWRCENMQASVTIYGDGTSLDTENRFWTAEMSLPFSAFFTTSSTPVSGTTWRMNIYRAEISGTREYSALVPTGSDSFHHPASFGTAAFN